MTMQTEPTMEINKIHQLVFSFLDSIGAQRTQDVDGIWRVQIPPAERQFFNGNEKYNFVFDRQVAEKHRELDLVCEGSYILKKIIERLASIPKVSRLFGTSSPELPQQEPGKGGELRLLTPGIVHYRQKILFIFKVSFLCDQRFDKIYTAVADSGNHDINLKEGTEEVDLTSFSEKPAPGIEIEESGEDLLRLYLMACQRLEGLVLERVTETRQRLKTSFDEEWAKVEAFLGEQKQELKQKKENVCFHLYFFQKEEEIERMMKDLETDHHRKLDELKEKFKLKVDITLLNAVILCIPTLGVSASFLAKKKREGQAPVIKSKSAGELGFMPVG